ncbi:MAG TPA: hypothetical protein VF665_24935 [Longimicrobium sp.]|jgi:hypothetical protein|uniref:hypothetical protein n=1 Tax=Longimicrobium sp. TaxID=2029185 RepID=UPI002EDA7292
MLRHLIFRPSSLVGAALVIACAPARAQTAADSAQIVEAVTGVLGEQYIPRMSRPGTLYLAQPVHRFDAWVMRRLQDVHGLPLMPTNADTADWIGARGFIMEGDTVAVMVDIGSTRRDPRSSIHTYIERRRFVFGRTPEGWRFVRDEFVMGADVGRVRG